MRFRPGIYVSSLFILFACEQPADVTGPIDLVAALPAVLQNDVVRDAPLSFYNGCADPDEEGYGIGTAQLRYSETVNDNHASWRLIYRISGNLVATNGTKYHVNSSWVGGASFDLADGAPHVFSQLADFQLISAGRGDNALASGYMHVTVNANGVPVAVKFDQFSVRCQG